MLGVLSIYNQNIIVQILNVFILDVNQLRLLRSYAMLLPEDF